MTMLYTKTKARRPKTKKCDLCSRRFLIARRGKVPELCPRCRSHFRAEMRRECLRERAASNGHAG